MKIKKITFLLFMCCIGFLFKTNLKAQIIEEEGYLVNLQNDTLFGLIEYLGGGTSKKLKFGINDNTSEAFYFPEDLKAFYLNSGQMYKSATVEIDKSSLDVTKLKYSKAGQWVKRTVFLKAEVLGKANLYSYVDENRKQHFFIEKDDQLTTLKYSRYFQTVKGQRVVKTNTTYKGQLNYLFRDCKQNNFDLNQVLFKKENLKNLVQKFNNCMGTTSMFVTKKNKLVTHLHLTIGFSNTTLNLRSSGNNELEATRFNNSLKPIAGIGFNIILPTKRRGVSIYNELNFRSFQVTSKESYLTSNNVMAEVEHSFKNSHIRLVSMGRWHILRNTFSPYLSAGISNGYALNIENKEIIRTITGTEVSNGKPFKYERKYEQGFVIGAGLKKNNIFLEYRFEKGNGVSGTTGLRTITKSNNLIFNYQFGN